MASSAKSGWRIPAALLLLTAVPVIAGAVRVADLAGGGEVTTGNARFFAAPVPVLLHIFGATVYCTLGAFQFAPGFRRRRPGWHRAAGRLLVPAGLIAALSGLWMTVFYRQPTGDSVLLTGLRIFFGSAMAVSIVLGFVSILKRKIARHRAWMIRGYAIAQGAGTQFLTHLPWIIFLGAPSDFTIALLMAAGWIINVVVAEWIIRRRPARPALTTTSSASLQPAR